jgi:O-antigen/teichoic acid export membrane protein
MNREGQEGRPRDKGDSISRNAVFAFATQLSTAFFTALLTVYLVRALGPAGFGTFALAVSITGLVLRPSDLGTTQSAARFVAERVGNTEGVAGVLGMALRTRLLTASGIALVLFALAGPISNVYNAPDLAWPLRGVAIGLFGQSLVVFSRAVFNALRRTSSGFTVVLSESAMEFSATVALVLVGGGATAAAFGRAVGYVFGALVGVTLLGRLLGRSPLFGTGPSPVSRRQFVGYAGAMLVVGGASAAFSVIDVLLIGAFLTTTSVGLFSAPLRLIAVLSYPGLALSQGVGPRFARHPDDPPQLDALERAIRYVVIAQASVLAFVTVWAGPVVDLTLGSKFSESAGVLRALAPYVFLTGISPVVTASLNYRGEARRRIPISIATLALNAAIDVVLIPKIGILGGAVGTDVSYAMYVGANFWLCHRLLGLPLNGVAKTTARAFLAAGAMAAVFALVGTGSLSTPEWIAGLLAGSAAFAAVLLVSRELSFGEMRFLATRPLKALRGG